MTAPASRTRCAIYTRKSSEEGLDQSFNSLHAQREACEAYVLSQKHEGWLVLPGQYDDGGFSGGNMERPGLKKLMTELGEGKIDTVIVYKVDRLTRSLADFAKIVESFDGKGVSFVSVTQQFNTTSSMGRLTLNVLLSFAQFEREVTGERIRDKVAASKKKGMWMGGNIPLGYDLVNQQLVVNEQEAAQVRAIFARYLELGSVTPLHEDLERSGVRSKRRVSGKGTVSGEAVLSRGTLYHLLCNPVYLGKTRHKEAVHPGMHKAIVDPETWRRTAALLAENTVTRRTSRNIASGRMLLGKLVTRDGQLYTPTHAAKGGRRYFYYTLKASSVRVDGALIRRLPACEVERCVIQSLRSFLEDSRRVAECFPSQDLRTTKRLTSAATDCAGILSEGSDLEKSRLIRRLVFQLTILPTKLHIQLSSGGLAGELLGEEVGSGASPESITLEAPFEVARRGNEVRLILAYGSQASQPVESLVHAVYEARTWAGWIAQGKVTTLKELAERAGHSRQHTSRVLRLAALSPALSDAILRGDHAPELTLEQLTQNIPLDWTLQKLPA